MNIPPVFQFSELGVDFQERYWTYLRDVPRAACSEKKRGREKDWGIGKGGGRAGYISWGQGGPVYFRKVHVGAGHILPSKRVTVRKAAGNHLVSRDDIYIFTASLMKYFIKIWISN